MPPVVLPAVSDWDRHGGNPDVGSSQNNVTSFSGMARPDVSPTRDPEQQRGGEPGSCDRVNEREALVNIVTSNKRKLRKGDVVDYATPSSPKNDPSRFRFFRGRPRGRRLASRPRWPAVLSIPLGTASKEILPGRSTSPSVWARLTCCSQPDGRSIRCSNAAACWA